jgi:hypothetical protein
MTYTSLFEPLLIISLCLRLGVVMGVIGMLIATARHIKDVNEEVDKFRDLYFEELDKWKSKYDQDDHEAY